MTDAAATTTSVDDKEEVLVSDVPLDDNASAPPARDAHEPYIHIANRHRHPRAGGPVSGCDLVVRRADGQLLGLQLNISGAQGPTFRKHHTRVEVPFADVGWWTMDNALQERIRQALIEESTQHGSRLLPGGSVDACMQLLLAPNPALGFRVIEDRWTEAEEGDDIEES
eukprot:m.188311 g.188311  ORF g.188311 m.188311 type:complete len:169 (-) comp17384_c0_seq1:2923-3429(-)